MASKSDEKCVKKTNLLVYKEPTGQKSGRGPCGDPSKYPPKYKIPICPGKPKQIRICTGADMKKMRPPKLCKCDKIQPRRGRGGLLGLLGFGLKAAVAAAAWYVTYDMGIWGTTEDTYELYRSYCKIVKGPCPEKAEKWEPLQCTAEKELIPTSKVDPFACCDVPPVDLQLRAYELQNNWNHAVSCVFSGIVGFPYNLINKIKPVSEKPEEDVKEKVCVPYCELPEEEKETIIRNAYRK